MNMKYCSGFNILETIIVLGFVLLAAVFSFSSFVGANKTQALDKDTAKVTSLLSRARTLTHGSQKDSQYGVHLEASKATLFRGATYSSSGPDNQIETMSSFVTIASTSLAGGGQDILFGLGSFETCHNVGPPR